MPLLFSYGTLQQEDVQLSTFQRLLQGQRDELPWFELSLVRIEDPQVVAMSGKTHHANAIFNGKDDSRVSGTVFEVTDAELAAADQYEQLAAYKRIAVVLASGKQAWVYVEARSAPAASSLDPLGAGREVPQMPVILQNHYVLAVHDVRKSAAFYVGALGFEVAAQPPGWIFVRKENCLIMLGECPDDMEATQLGCHSYFAYLRVDDADAYHAQIAASGLPAQVGPVTSEPWGMREFSVTTPDGHRIRIGHIIAS